MNARTFVAQPENRPISFTRATETVIFRPQIQSVGPFFDDEGNLPAGPGVLISVPVAALVRRPDPPGPNRAVIIFKRKKGFAP
ncbi:hypothetical protein [Sphingobium fontiphilum]|uniref:hypothetical protein n=1 Tax=Sphingobium fontiphilum TaxID=944425 RepID=UPI001621B686|nr:hypothetical protein [Sphingobium fontiphilum]